MFAQSEFGFSKRSYHCKHGAAAVVAVVPRHRRGRLRYRSLGSLFILFVIPRKRERSCLSMHDLFLFFSVHSGFVPIFVLSKAALTPRTETITTNLAGEFSSTVLDHHRRSSDAASKFRLPNAACLPLSLVQFSLPLQLEYRTPRDRPTAQTQRTHTRTLSRPDRN